MVDERQEIREQIIELNYYLLQSMLKGDDKGVDNIRKDINKLIDAYLKNNQ